MRGWEQRILSAHPLKSVEDATPAKDGGWRLQSNKLWALPWTCVWCFFIDNPNAGRESVPLTLPALACMMKLPQVGWVIAVLLVRIEESPHSTERSAEETSGWSNLSDRATETNSHPHPNPLPSGEGTPSPLGEGPGMRAGHGEKVV